MFTTDEPTDAQGYTREEAPLEPFHFMIDDAIKRIEAGGEPNHIVEKLTKQLPAHLHELARKAIRRKARIPANLGTPGQQANMPAAPAKSGGLASVANMISQAVLQKIRQIFRLNPSLEKTVRDAGKVLARNGVTPDMIRLTDGALGSLSPSAARGTGKQQAPNVNTPPSQRS